MTLGKINRMPFRYRFCNLALGAVLGSSFANAEPIEPEVDTKMIKLLIKQYKIKTVDELLEKLPKSFLANAVPVHHSGSTQPATYDNPRVILVSSKLLLTFNGDPALSEESPNPYDKIEMIDLENHRGIELGSPFTEAQVNSLDATTGPRAPDSCVKCHGRNMTPRWNHYPEWPSAYGGIDHGKLAAHRIETKRVPDETLPAVVEESSHYTSFLERAANHKRYKLLQKRLPDGTYEPLYSDAGKNPTHTPDLVIPHMMESDNYSDNGPELLTHLLAENQAASLVEIAKGSPNYPIFKSALFVLKSCRLDRSTKLTRLFKKALEAAISKFAPQPNFEFNIAHTEDVNFGYEQYVQSALDISNPEDWNLSFPLKPRKSRMNDKKYSAQYEFARGNTMIGMSEAFQFHLARDLSKSYAKLSNLMPLDKVDRSFLNDAYSANVSNWDGEEYNDKMTVTCNFMMKKAISELAKARKISLRNAEENQKEVSLCKNNFSVPEKKLLQTALKSCISCHSSKETNAPIISFDNPSKLTTELNRRPKDNTTSLGNQIVSRIFTQDPHLKMPKNSNLSEEQKSLFQRYVKFCGELSSDKENPVH